jgi:hypothetical protein
MEKQTNILKNWKLCIGIFIIVLTVTGICIFTFRNKLTPEETLSRFLYLIETKNYSEAKKLCSEKLEYLDLLSNIKPANLTFKYSDDKRKATSVLLENKETAEMTTMYVELNNSLMGWKIKKYTINTDFISQSILQERLENNEEISQNEFLLWALSDETKAEDISKYANDNLIVLTLFADFMKNKLYDKAMKLYKPINSELYNAKELSENEMKEFDWGDYNIYNHTEFLGINTYMIRNNDKKINVMINMDHTISHIYKQSI